MGTYAEHRDYFDHTLAEAMVEDRDFSAAATLLRRLGAEQPSAPLAARMLLARALYSSAQLGRAEALLRSVVADRPDEAYAHLMLGRVLQRAGRAEEARGPLRLAAAMGLTLDGAPPNA